MEFSLFGLGMTQALRFLVQLSNITLQDLSRHGPRKLLNHNKSARDLIMRDMLGEVFPERLGRHRLAILHDNVHDWQFLLILVFMGRANHGAVFDCRMAIHDLLDFVGIHVQAVNNDHIFLAVDDPDISLLVYGCDIAREEPSVPDGLCRILWTIVVPLHDIRSPHRQFPGGPGRQCLSFIIYYLHFQAGQWQADGAWLVPAWFKGIDGDNGRRLCEAVAFQERHLEGSLEVAEDPDREGRSPGNTEPQIKQEFHEERHVLFGKNLINGRDRHKEGDPVDDEAFHYPGERPYRWQEGDRCADEDRKNHADRIGERVEQRQKDDKPVLLRHMNDLSGGKGIGDEIAVREESPLRPARCSRGVENGRNIVG